MFNKFTNALRELGPARTLWYVAYRICAKTGGWAALHCYLIVAQPVPDRSLLPPNRGRSIMVKQVSHMDPALQSLPLQASVLNYRSAQRAICFAAYKGQEIIGCLWLCLSPYEEDEVRCRYHPLPAGQASWDFDVYLKPEYRNGLGFARLWDEANQFLRARGVASSWSRISAFNPGSIGAHRRLGATIMGSATFFRIGRCQIMVASMPPYFHLSLSSANMPDLRLSRSLRAPRSTLISQHASDRPNQSTRSP